MQSNSIRKRLYIWIACFAVLMNALAPAISHALAGVRGGVPTWEICRADALAEAVPGHPELLVVGNNATLVKKITGATERTAMGFMEHCAYCLPHAGAFALLPTAVSGLGIFGGHALRPFLFYRAPQPLPALSAAAPRGPPAA
jgi:hypothetical protein